MSEQSKNKYVVRVSGQDDRGFGDGLDEAIAYAADAAQTSHETEVWMTGSEDDPGVETLVWPEDSGDE